MCIDVMIAVTCQKLLPRLEYIDLSHNSLVDLEQLQYLSALTAVDLSHNNIRRLDMLHTKLGNIKTLSLAHNKLESLSGQRAGEIQDYL